MNAQDNEVLPTQFVHSRVKRRLLDIRDDDPHALAGKALGKRSTYAARSSRNHRHFAGKLSQSATQPQPKAAVSPAHHPKTSAGPMVPPAPG